MILLALYDYENGDTETECSELTASMNFPVASLTFEQVCDLSCSLREMSCNLEYDFFGQNLQVFERQALAEFSLSDCT